METNMVGVFKKAQYNVVTVPQVFFSMKTAAAGTAGALSYEQALKGHLALPSKLS